MWFATTTGVFKLNALEPETLYLVRFALDDGGEPIGTVSFRTRPLVEREGVQSRLAVLWCELWAHSHRRATFCVGSHRSITHTQAIVCTKTTTQKVPGDIWPKSSRHRRVSVVGIKRTPFPACLTSARAHNQSHYIWEIKSMLTVTQLGILNK